MYLPEIFGMLCSMYKFIQGRLFFTRLVLLAASVTLLIIGICAIYAVGHPDENSPASDAEQFSGFWKKLQ